MGEQWKDIVIESNGVLYNFEGKYEVSNMGRVRSLNYRGTGEVRLLKQGKDKGGYFRVSLYKNGKTKAFLVHRLVATAFIPNNDIDKTEVNHIDENKQNNCVTNLEWVTSKDNINHGTRNKRASKSMKGHKPTRRRKVVCIEINKEFDTIKEAEEWLGKGNISDCLSGRKNSAGGYHWKYAD